LERHYWRNLTFGEPLYGIRQKNEALFDVQILGADTPGSCYEDSVERFNVSKLRTILDLLKEVGVRTHFQTNLKITNYRLIFLE
jgi:hypothetical protein